MNIVEIYKKFPTHKSCLKHLEKVRWQGEKPACPYCKSQHTTSMPKELRHHCNVCNTSFKVTVGTIFHNTKCDLQKWFLAISIILNAKKGISSRQLARDIAVNKDTAWYMQMRIRKAMTQDSELLKGIVEADETYVGGKNKNRHKNKRIKGTQGRSTKDKVPVFGTLERGGNIKAGKVENVQSETLTTVVKNNVEKGSKIMTDEWIGYKDLSNDFIHEFVSHSHEEYKRGDCHVNTIEGFWSLLKRGIMGQYHKLSKKWLNKYVDEFTFRYNNRKNLSIFDLTLKRGLGV